MLLGYKKALQALPLFCYTSMHCSSIMQDWWQPQPSECSAVTLAEQSRSVLSSKVAKDLAQLDTTNESTLYSDHPVLNKEAVNVRRRVQT